MSTASFNLAPRGCGRLSFRLAEAIQMGRVPVFLWDDAPWIPYAGTSISIDTLGFQHAQKPQYSKLIEQLKALKTNKHGAYRKLSQAVKEVGHFYQGIMEQIEHFIADSFDVRGTGTRTGVAGNYLRCSKHPRSVRCCDAAAKKTRVKSANSCNRRTVGVHA